MATALTIITASNAIADVLRPFTRDERARLLRAAALILGLRDPAPVRLLVETAEALERMATEAKTGGWSTQHVEPMRQLADKLRLAASTLLLRGGA
jgi:hypothetical protein